MIVAFHVKKCSKCHAGLNIGGDGYYPFGLFKTRFGNTSVDEDKGRFEVIKTGEPNHHRIAGDQRT